MKIEDVEIRKIKLKDKDNLVALVDICFDCVVNKNFRLLVSVYPNKYGDNVWLQPPYFKDGGGKFHNLVHVENPDLWKKVQDKVYEAYHEDIKAEELVKDVPF